MEPLLILTNVPDVAEAEKLAHALIESRAAACVNVLAACRSIYRWRGAVETADEIPLLINADAHFPEFLTRNFNRARDLAREAGYTELVRYDQREAIPYPLD